MDIQGYLLDKYNWISLMDMWLGYLWICLDITWISSVDIFSWIYLKRYPICPKISKRYPFISNNIQQYPKISKDIQWGELPDVGTLCRGRCCWSLASHLDEHLDCLKQPFLADYAWRRRDALQLFHSCLPIHNDLHIHHLFFQHSDGKDGSLGQHSKTQYHDS